MKYQFSILNLGRQICNRVTLEKGVIGILEGKVVVAAGAGRGIGRALALRCAECRIGQQRSRRGAGHRGRADPCLSVRLRPR